MTTVRKLFFFCLMTPPWQSPNLSAEVRSEGRKEGRKVGVVRRQVGHTFLVFGISPFPGGRDSISRREERRRREGRGTILLLGGAPAPRMDLNFPPLFLYRTGKGGDSIDFYFSPKIFLRITTTRQVIY